MNSKLGTVLSFTLGAAIGSFVSWQILKNKYKQISDQEIADVKARYVELYGDKKENNTPELPAPEKENTEQNIKDYAAMLAKSGYTNYSNTEEPEEVLSKPYVVDGADFSDDFELVTLTYFNDGVLADKDLNIITDLEGTVGDDVGRYFEDELDDSVYIRNDVTKQEYEILRDTKDYADAVRMSSPR